MKIIEVREKGSKRFEGKQRKQEGNDSYFSFYKGKWASSNIEGTNFAS